MTATAATKMLKVRFTEIGIDDMGAYWTDNPAEFREQCEAWANKMAGKRCYVTTTERPRSTHPTYHFSVRPGRTNMSHEERVKGWLGTTNDVYRSALGYFEVTGHSSTHLHLREIEPAD
jgi:hypothetical protein